jgi:hypothetical protein
MDGRDKLPDDGRVQTQGRKDDAVTPQAEGGENTTPERFPPVKKDDSVEQRSFEGETGYTEPERRSGDDGPDPSVSHGQTDTDEAAPDGSQR